MQIVRGTSYRVSMFGIENRRLREDNMQYARVEMLEKVVHEINNFNVNRNCLVCEVLDKIKMKDFFGTSPQLLVIHIFLFFI